MEPNELAKKLKNRLEQWSKSLAKVKSVNMMYSPPPRTNGLFLWDISERDLTNCVTEILSKEKWACFFEIAYKTKGKELEKCDILATKSRQPNIWIECKLVSHGDRSPSTQQWEKCGHDLTRLKRISKRNNRERAYLVVFERSKGKSQENVKKKRKTLGLSEPGYNVEDKGDPRGKAKVRYTIWVDEVKRKES